MHMKRSITRFVQRLQPKVLSELIKANGLRQKDLASIFGSESGVSMAASGGRPLTARQISKLSKRFHVSPGLFF